MLLRAIGGEAHGQRFRVGADSKGLRVPGMDGHYAYVVKDFKFEGYGCHFYERALVLKDMGKYEASSLWMSLLNLRREDRNG